jgi:hypothetical protein
MTTEILTGAKFVGAGAASIGAGGSGAGIGTVFGNTDILKLNPLYCLTQKECNNMTQIW